MKTHTLTRLFMLTLLSATLLRAADVTWNVGTGTWNTSDANWVDTNVDPASFVDGDHTFFVDRSTAPDPSLNIHIVVDGTQLPGSMTFSNARDIYTVTNGTLGGGGLLTVDGGGIVRFGNNTFLDFGIGDLATPTMNHGNTLITNGSMLNRVQSTAATFGTGTITLDTGGIFRFSGMANQDYSFNTGFNIGAGGGVIEVHQDSTNNRRQNVTVNSLISGTGNLTLRAGSIDNRESGGLHFTNTGNAAAWTGNSITIARTANTHNNITSAWNVSFAGQNSVPGGANTQILLAGGQVPVLGIRATDTYANDIDFSGASATGGVHGNGGAGIRMDASATLSGNLTGGGRNFNIYGASVFNYAPAVGNAWTMDSGTTIFVRDTSILHVDTMGVIPNNANLNLISGVVLLDGSGALAPTLADFQAARSLGTGDGQYQLTGGGFAAANTDVTLNGIDMNRNITLGHQNIALANAALIVDSDITLSGNRAWNIGGDNASSSLGGWQLRGPIHEINGVISGSGNLTFNGVNQAGGTVRLSGENTFTGTFHVGTVRQSAVVIATSDAAFGNAANLIHVGATNQDAGSLILLEDVNPGGSTTFSRDIRITNRAGTGIREGVHGFGSYAGEVVYSGTLDLRTGNKWAIHAEGGSTLTFNGATIAMTLANSGAQTFWKNGEGTLDLGDIAYTGTQSFSWSLGRGTLITREHGQLGSSNFSNLFDGGGTKTLQISDHSPTVTITGSQNFDGDATLVVEAGRTVQFLSDDRFQGTNASSVFRKQGEGTLVIHSSNIDNSDAGNAGSRFVVEAGIADVNANMSRTGGRIDGGTLLIRNGLGWGAADNRAFEIGVNGGKVGIATVGDGDVSRGALTSWDQSGTSTVTFASRGDDSLIFGGWTGNTVGANTTLLIEHDGAPGAGVVQINQNELTVDGVLGGSGRLRLQSGGTGTVTVNGLFSPGSSPGLLEIEGNLVLNGSSETLMELDGLTRGILYDATDISGDLTYGGIMNVQIGFSAPGNTVFDLFSALGDISGEFSSINLLGNHVATLDSDNGFTALDGNGLEWTFNHASGQLTVIPEPGTLALVVLTGLAMVLGLRRRR